MEKSPESKIEYPRLAEELLQMKELDQAMRNGEWDESVDKRNTKRLKEIINDIAWPTITKVGKDASYAAWLIAQHADLDVNFQESCLALMQAEDESEVSLKNIAYLTDRVKVARGEPQVYGTQFYVNDEGEFGPRPIGDRDKLDERIESVGLQPFREYEKTIVSLHLEQLKKKDENNQP